MEFEKSILDNVIYLDIETTGLDEYNSEIIEVGALKVKNSQITKYSTLIRPRGRVPINIYELCSGLDEKELKQAKRINEVKKELMSFIEDYPLICHNGGFEKRFLNHHIPEIKNRILDSMELSAILEPWRKEFNLQALLNEITLIDKKEAHRGLQDSIDTMKVVNSLLCRQWFREEKNNKKKKVSLYKILVQDYGLDRQWGWTKYLERPLLFSGEEYDYVSYEEEKKEEVTLEKINIPYKEFEGLLKRKDIWNNGGDFGYQYREEQLRFSEKIRYNIENDEKIFIEAPTGSGKTFAYVLVTALEAYKNMNSHKVEDASFIISTDTKELQNQLIDKDIPDILRKLFLDNKLKYGAIKGKSNYICVERLIKFKCLKNDLEGKLVEIFLKRLCANGKYGDIENISFWASNHFNLGEYIKEVACDSEECNLDKCRRNCYLRNRYLELPHENITVVNHSLLASWPYNEKKKITHLIIDEAHNLMDKCYDFFSEEFRSDDFQKLLDLAYTNEPTIFRALINLNASNGYRETIELDKIKYWVVEIQNILYMFLNKAMELNLADSVYNFKTEYMLCTEELKVGMLELEPYLSKIKENIYGLFSLLNRYMKNITLDGEEGKEDYEYETIMNYIMKLKSSFDVIDKFIEKQEKVNNYAKVLEVSKEYEYFVLTNTPLNIDELFNEQILKDVKSTTFLSATMRISNSFNRIKNHLGQQEAKELIVPPTFKLKERTRIFNIDDIGPYNSRDFVLNSARFIFNMAKKLNGHILVLFTNNLRKKAVEEELNSLIAGTRIEVHTNKKSIRYLKDKNRQIVILGSKGFFEGIDVPGDWLTAVILDKLPNKSIEDPLLKAITSYRQKDYKYVNYPQLCIKVKQVYGRLIRSIMDYGYFCILDGGQNSKTLWQLERDLCGPKFIRCSTNTILRNIDEDYKRWRMENLSNLIKKSGSNNIDIINNFNIEAQKMKSFWEIMTESNNVKFKFINLIIK